MTTATRSPALPNIPTASKFVPGYEASSWYGIGAPKNTPTEIVEKLNNEINASLPDPKLITRLAGGSAGATCRRGNCHRHMKDSRLGHGFASSASREAVLGQIAVGRAQRRKRRRISP